MRRFAALALGLLACALAPHAAFAQLRALPTCSGLVPALERDRELIRSGLAITRVDAIVEDISSTPDARFCTGVAHYPDGAIHLTYSAFWSDAAKTSYAVEGHETTAHETASRALSLRVRLHPVGDDGTFSTNDYVPYCTDARFRHMATRELHLGISTDVGFYREPDFTIKKMAVNGYGSGILANCVATVGDGAAQGAIFIGTDWAPGAANRRYQFYILAAGPDGWKLPNRLWRLGAE